MQWSVTFAVTIVDNRHEPLQQHRKFIQFINVTATSFMKRVLLPEVDSDPGILSQKCTNLRRWTRVCHFEQCYVDFTELVSGFVRFVH